LINVSNSMSNAPHSNPMTAALINDLAHPDRSVRGRAAIALGELREDATVEPLIAALVAEADFFVRENLTWALVRLSEPALPLLIDRLRDPDPAARHHSAHVLSKIGDPRAVEALIERLADVDAVVVSKAAYALAAMGAARAIPALIAQLGHPASETRTAISQSLERFDAAAVPALITALKVDHTAAREHAADALALIADPAAVPALITTLADPEARVRLAAVTALDHIDDQAAMDALADHHDPDPTVVYLIERVVKRSSAR
jgi:HEAT repeat protein